MSLLQKARILGEAGKFDSCGPKQCEVKVKNNLTGLYHAESENKNCIMLKTLMTNKCGFDCKYCPNSTRSKPTSKAEYTPQELLKVFESAKNKLNINGLFLSSGIPHMQEETMNNMLDSVAMIRKKFTGYIHLKIMPGTPYDLVRRAARLSNRVSINIEAPNNASLSEMSDCKDLKTDILRRQAWLKKLNVSQSTQMIVKKQDTDKDILKMANWEYKNMNLKRVYYSAFTPVKGTPMMQEKKESTMRQNNLYKADFLMKQYNYKLQEILNVMNEDMLTKQDPKLLIAREEIRNRIDVNEASRDELIRIPGIGLKATSKIISTREKQKIMNMKEIQKLGANIKQAAPFLRVNGKIQTTLTSF